MTSIPASAIPSWDKIIERGAMAGKTPVIVMALTPKAYSSREKGMLGPWLRDYLLQHKEKLMQYMPVVITSDEIDLGLAMMPGAPQKAVSIIFVSNECPTIEEDIKWINEHKIEEGIPFDHGTMYRLMEL